MPMDDFTQRMTEFVESTGFIIFFLILCLGIGMFLGEKTLYWFLLLVLLGMVYVGWPKIGVLISKYSGG